MDSKDRILLVDDDKEILSVMGELLESDGFEVVKASSGAQAVSVFSSDISLVILDIMMPHMSGYEVCQKIRAISYVPILFLTARSGENDKLRGFHSGADDYIVKPFSYAELSARMNAILRRHKVYDNSDSDDNWLTFEELKINTSKNEVIDHGKAVLLTPTEYQILLLLAKNKDQIFPLEKIYEQVWGGAYNIKCANTVMVHIRNLRAKVEPDPTIPRYIVNIFGKGYRWNYFSDNQVED